MIPWDSFFEKMNNDGNVKDAIQDMKYVLIGLENKVQHDPSGD